MADAPRLLLGKLRQPAAIGPHDCVVAKPALVDPCVRAEQEAIGMTGEQFSPLGGKLALAVGEPAAVGYVSSSSRTRAVGVENPVWALMILALRLCASKIRRAASSQWARR